MTTNNTERKKVWQGKLAQSRQALLDLLTVLNDEQWQTLVFSEGAEWTVTNVVAHLMEAETGMSIHVHKIRKGGQTIPDDFDLDRWNAGVAKRTNCLTTTTLLEKLAKTRTKTLEVMNSLKDDDWIKPGRHASRGVISIEQYYETIHGHEIMHTQDIKRALGIAL